MNFKKSIALLLAVVLCVCALSGCSIGRLLTDIAEGTRTPAGASAPRGVESAAPSPSVSAASTERRTVPFDEMVYERPDPDAMTARIDEITGEIKASDDFEVIAPLVEEAEELRDHYLSMNSLAYVYASMDRSDDYWVEEERVTSEKWPGVYGSTEKMYRYLFESPYKELCEERWGADYFDGMPETDLITDATQPLYEKEAQLVSDYMEKLAKGTVDYGGSELTMEEITVEAETYEEYQDLVARWFETNAPVLGGIYIELVQVRQQIAAELGYDNYIEYIFDGEDYTFPMVESLIDDIVEYVVPVYKHQADLGYLYYPEVSTDLDTFTGEAREVLDDLNPELADSFDAMLDYGLYDFEPRAYKDSGAYTTYIYDYDAPFILSTYADDAYSMSTIIHEFGHFNDRYTNLGEGHSIDEAEIFSQGLELLYSRYYPSQYGEEDGYEMQYDTLSNGFSAMASQPFYTAMEQRIYQMDPDDLTVEGINEIAREEAERFGMASDDHIDFGGGAWVSVTHIFESPFYTISYVTSMDVALQIWELSLDDMDAAMAAYNATLHPENPGDFIRIVEDAGLENPFAPGRMADVARIGETYLIDEDWGDVEPLAA